MRSSLKRISLFSILAVVVIAGSVAAAFMWRLSQGPVALTFLKGHVQDQLNASLAGMRATIGDVIIERDVETGKPRFRMRDIKVTDASGETLIQAPRAAIKVNGMALLAGSVEPIEFELIGPQLVVRRLLDGSLRLGFGSADAVAAPVAEVASPSDAQGTSTRADREDADLDGLPPYDTQSLKVISEFYQAFLAEDGRLAAIPSLNLIRVSEAQITVHDDANDAEWKAPRANLVFNRVPYGVALFADAQIATDNEPWRTEVVANYKSETRSFSVSARIFDLVPADLSKKVFALSQLAQVRLPLSGRAEVEFTEDGVIGKASAELSAAAGEVGFPGYISEPIIIDEGSIRLDYEPATGDLLISNSSIYIGGSQAMVEGRIHPVRTPEGRLKAVQLALSASNVAIDGGGDPAGRLALDRVEIKGEAALDEARVEVEDLTLMAGDGGVRVRGRIVGGDKAMGVYASGVVRDLHSDVIKKLWPPVVAAGAREWMHPNILNAHIVEGTFQIAIPGEALAAALEDVPLPDDMVDVRFTLKDVDTRYFETLPPLKGAHGKGHLTGDNFLLELSDGHVELPSGKRVVMSHGTMRSTALAAKLSPTEFRLTAGGDAPAVLELLDHEPLKLVTEAGFDAARIGGEVGVDLSIDVPLARKVPENSARVGAVARLDKASFREPVEGMNLEDGKIEVVVGDDGLRATGPVKLNGIPAELVWTRRFATEIPEADQFEIEAEFDEKARERLGVRLQDFLRGPVKVKVTAEERNGRISKAHVAADLGKAELRIDPIGWSRPAGTKTSAEFDLNLGDPKVVSINNLKIGGGELKVAGDIKIHDSGTVEATFSSLRLNEETDLAVRIKADSKVLDVTANGRSFDARPLIGDLFGPVKGDGGEKAEGTLIRLKASIDRLHVYRGEIISSVDGAFRVSGSTVEEANLKGVFPNGAPVVLKITPDGSGSRQMSLTGRDAGATLRAANLYSKISGGTIDLRATLAAGRRGGVQQGMLVIRDFKVLDDEVFTDLERKTPAGQKGQTGPRRGGQSFSKLSIPFSVDQNFVRIGDALVKGPGLGASAQGHIRKADGAMDIGGTIIPAYELNSALGEVPILGQIIVGGKGQGLFGLNYALKGTMKEPKFIVNPVSAIAPGIFRRLFDMGGGGVAADGTPEKARPTSELPDSRK